MKAMILAAGAGRRLGTLGQQLPKACLNIGGEPLVVHHIKKLQSAGITDIVINYAYLGEHIVEAVGDGRQWGVNIHYSPEAPPGLETGGGIFNVLDVLGSEPFCVMNADLWSDFDYRLLRREPEQLAHLIMVPNPDFHPTGDYYLDQGYISQHATMTDTSKYTFAGIGVYRPELFHGSQPGRFKLAPLLNQAMETKGVTGELYDGPWFNINTPETYQQVQEWLDDKINSYSNASE